MPERSAPRTTLLPSRRPVPLVPRPPRPAAVRAGSFAAEEVPEPLALDAPFGTYRLEVRAAGDTLVTTRSYRIRPGRVPPERYPALRDFCARIHAAEQVSVVVSRH